MSMQNNPYADIMQLKRPESHHPHMAVIDRAAQFLPFAALTGYEEAIQEAGRLTQERRDEDEGLRAALDEKLHILLEHSGERPKVKITWFAPDERKSGGAYLSGTGTIRKTDEYRRVVILEDGTEIPMDTIVELDSDMFDFFY